MSVTALSPSQESRPRRPSPLATWLVLLVTGGGFVAVLVHTLRSGAEAGQGMPPFSAYSDGADGLAQAASVLRKLGWRPTAVTRPIQQTRHRGLLFVVEPGRADALGRWIPEISPEDAAAMLRWVAKGNTLVLAGRGRTALHALLGVFPSGPPGDDAVRVIDGVELSGYTEGVKRLAVEGRASVEATGPALPLWWVGGKPGALLLPHGAGRVVVLADPSLLTHRGLLRQDNVLLLHNLAAAESRDGRVLFDEYHRGIRAGGGYWGYLQYHNQQWAVLQLLAVAAFAGWSVAVRLGPAAPAPPAATADAVDYAAAAARIYYQAGAIFLIAALVARDFLDGLAALLHVRRGAPAADVLAAWRERYPDAASREELRGLLEAAENLKGAADRREPLRDRDVLGWVRAFDEFLAGARRRV